MFTRPYEKDISVHSGIPRQYSHLKNKQFKNWEIPPWEIFIDSNKLLGEGSWAKVYLAEWRHTKVVAKVLKNDFDLHAKNLIIKELNNMTKMHHPNIVQLFGYVEEPFVIIMEYFENGDLYSNLHKLKLNKKIKIATDIIKGLIYIHERRPNGLIHRDLKLRNILLTNSYTAKIADFGLSTFSMEKFIKIASNNNLINLDINYIDINYIDMNYTDDVYQHNYNQLINSNSNELTKEVGTLRYMAPEIKSGKYNNKVDIYSCGILLYELFTNNIYLDSFKWTKKLPISFKNLIIRMTSKNSEYRPSAREIILLFEKIIFTISIYDYNLRMLRK